MPRKREKIANLAYRLLGVLTPVTYLASSLLATIESNDSFAAWVNATLCTFLVPPSGKPVVCPLDVRSRIPQTLVLLFLVVTPVLYLAQWTIEACHQKKQSRLRHQQRSFQRLIAESLREIFYNLRMGPTERISIYWYDKESEVFIILGRFSSNGFLEKIRRQYFKRQGYIWRAWQNGRHFEGSSPPKHWGGLLKYLKCNLSVGIFPWEALARRMKTASYYGLVLCDQKNERLPAIAMFESTKESGLNQLEIDTLLQSNVISDLQSLLQAYHACQLR